MRPALFLDRDGVLNRTVKENGTTRAPKSLDELQLLPGVLDALARAAKSFPLVVITNQTDVAHGLITQDEVEEIHAVLRRTLPLSAILTCFHNDKAGCDCHKPRPGCFLRAAAQLDLDLPRSFAVGDHWIHTAAARSAGCGMTYLIRGPNDEWTRCPPDFVVTDLAEAVDRISTTQAVARPAE